VGFDAKFSFGLAVVLLCAAMDRVTAQESSHIRVMVHNSAGVPAAVLRRGEAEAGRMFRAAEIEIDWVNCAMSDSPGECRRFPGANDFVLHIVPDGTTRSALVFGESFLGEDGRGKYADVFFRRIESTAGKDIDISRLLAAVGAHELGHLLLGSGAHSTVGIMAPIWKYDSLRRIGMGTLLFTPQQSQLMRSRIGDDRGHLGLIRVATRSTVDDWF